MLISGLLMSWLTMSRQEADKKPPTSYQLATTAAGIFRLVARGTAAEFCVFSCLTGAFEARKGVYLVRTYQILSRSVRLGCFVTQPITSGGVSKLTASLFRRQRGKVSIINGDCSIGQQKKPGVPDGDGECTHVTRGRSRMTIGPRIPSEARHRSYS